jgi:YspA, cpYpsA-related SLOG family
MMSLLRFIDEPMKVIVAGTRTIDDYRLVAGAIDLFPYEIKEIVSGCAKGVDSLGEEFASNHNILVKSFPADWNLYGKSAGPIRNKKMAEYADGLVLVWDGKSKGSANMLEEAKKKNLIIVEIVLTYPDKSNIIDSVLATCNYFNV